MDLVFPCNSCTLHYRKLSAPKRCCFPFNSFKCRRKTTSELQTPVSVTSPNCNLSPSIPTHKVTVHDRKQGVVHEFIVPEVRRSALISTYYIRLNLKTLRFHSLAGTGYALLCVGFPSSDLEVETQDEDEVYWLQFGRYFARGPIERDDYASELAMGDE
ncbi:hypothetical protein CRYUN_Cryun07bG0184900 [Craigia yunnanensis]